MRYLVLEFARSPGGTTIYWLYEYVPLERVWFSSQFTLLLGIVIIENWSRIERTKFVIIKDGNQEQLSVFTLVYGHKICKIYSSKG